MIRCDAPGLAFLLTMLAPMQLGACGPPNPLGLAPLESSTPAPLARDLAYAYDDN
jgi:hypothetical protein